MKIIVTQHTTSEWNSTGRIQGQTDISLNSQGLSEASCLVGALLGLKINLIVSSDLKRAKETAEIINAVIDAPLRFDKRLRECSFGKIEGLTEQQAIDKYGTSAFPDPRNKYLNYNFKSFGGESRDEVFSRHIEALNAIVKKDNGKIVLVVGHCLGMNTLLSGLGYAAELKQGEFQIIGFS